MNIAPVRPGSYDFHVVPVGKHWAVKGELQTEYVGHSATQLEATSYAMRLAREAASSVIIHGRDGRFQSVWNYR